MVGRGVSCRGHEDYGGAKSPCKSLSIFKVANVVNIIGKRLDFRSLNCIMFLAFSHLFYI